MPYIKAADRNRIDQAINLIPPLLSAGEMNYAVTRILDRFLDEHGFNYTNINQVVGVLECAKLEAYRRLAAPYEDHKILENGDVYKSGKSVWEKSRALVRTLIERISALADGKRSGPEAPDGRRDHGSVDPGQSPVPYETGCLEPPEGGRGQQPASVRGGEVSGASGDQSKPQAG